jgi:hypothetical protein
LKALQELSIEPEINLDGGKLKQRKFLGVKENNFGGFKPTRLVHEHFGLGLLA